MSTPLKGPKPDDYPRRHPVPRRRPPAGATSRPGRPCRPAVTGGTRPAGLGSTPPAHRPAAAVRTSRRDASATGRQPLGGLSRDLDQIGAGAAEPPFEPALKQRERIEPDLLESL